MKKSRNPLRTTAIALLMALSLPAAALAAGQVGEMAYNFMLIDPADGTSHSMSDSDGFVRFLFFFGHS